MPTVKPKNRPQPTWPAHLEREYRRSLEARADVITNLAKRIIVSNPLTQNDFRQDSVSELLVLWRRLRDAVRSILPTGRIVEEQLIDLARRTEVSVTNQLVSRIGNSVPEVGDSINRRLGGLYSDWADENLKLVESIDTRQLDDIRDKVIETFETGGSIEDLENVIVRRGEVSKSRARVIARDQLGNLNSKVIETRQRDAGITHYIWRTSRDERVRPSHAARAGREFAWSDPPADGHPGEPIQCRCTAEAVVNI